MLQLHHDRMHIHCETEMRCKSDCQESLNYKNELK